jgi:hypothetical protein
MLYPLSYEGLRCRFAQHDGRVLVRRLGLAASLQTACAAPVPRALNQLIRHCPGTRRRLYGGGAEPRAGGRRSNEVTTVGWCWLGATGCHTAFRWLCRGWRRCQPSWMPAG